MIRAWTAALLALVLALPAAAGDLSAIADEWSVDLTTTGRKSGKPRSVTIWFVAEDGLVFVQSGKGGETDWYRNLLADPEVTLGFESRRIDGRAVPIEDPAEAERVRGLFLSKYWTARISSWFGMGLGTGEVVRIEPTDDPAPFAVEQP